MGKFNHLQKMGEKSAMDPYVPFAQFQELSTQNHFFSVNPPHTHTHKTIFSRILKQILGIVALLL